jgi:hypothetical protein
LKGGNSQHKIKTNPNNNNKKGCQLMKAPLLYSLIMVAFSSPVFAGALGDSDSKSGTYYTGASLGRADNQACGNAQCQDTAWKVFGGYKINSEFGVEGGYHNFGSKNGVDTSGVSLAGTAAYSIGEGYDIIGKAGLMNWKSSASETQASNKGTNLLIGAGVNYKVDDHWGVRGEYEKVSGDLQADMYSIGATYSSM